jgi:hypothetical protein
VRIFWQALTAWILAAVVTTAAETKPSFTWEPIRVQQSMFTRDLGMLDTEREEYATNLAALAVNRIAADKASPQALAEARRFLALALHLSPRNKRAIVVNYQLAKGIIPEATEGIYSPQVFARLLLTRGQLLAKEANGQNQLLARVFTHLAASLDPKNEDAVYASEVHRLDHGSIDWDPFTNPESTATKPESE